MNTWRRQERARVHDERFVPEENHERIVNVTAAEYQRRSGALSKLAGSSPKAQSDRIVIPRRDLTHVDEKI
jgi:hypothetical protein